MSAVNEHRIICRILTEPADITALRDRGVDGSWFFNEQHREAVEFILRHHGKYGTVPNRATFVSQFGTAYKVFAVRESIDYLLDVQAEALQREHAKDAIFRIEDLLKSGDTVGAVDTLRSSLGKIDSFVPVASRLVDSMDNVEADTRLDEYHHRASKKGLVGLSTGFPTIDEATLGLQSGQLITVMAQPKVGKTTVCMVIGNHVYSVHEKPVLFISFEMGIRELSMRQDSLMAGVPFNDLQAGSLSKPDLIKYEEYLETVKDTRDWPFWFSDASSGSTVGAVSARIERLEPELVVVDGIYMMLDEQSGETNTWMAITNITRSLKRLATQTQIPIVINSQALPSKSKGVRISMDSAGYSSSFAQDSDVVLGIEKMQVPKGENEAAYAHSRMLRVLASRNTGLAEVELRFDYDTGEISEAV